MDRNIQADLEEYRKQKTQSGVAPLTAPTGTRNITADLEAYRLKKDKPKTYAEKSAEMQSQGQAVATKGRFNRTGEITPSLGGNIVRGIARIPVEGALTVARGFGGLVSDKISDEGLTVKSKFLGDTKDYATSVGDTAKELADRVNKGEISKGRAYLGVLGASAEKTLDLASVVPAGAVLGASKTALTQGAKGVAREAILPATKTAFKRSGLIAGAYDVAQQAKEGEGYNPLRTAGAVALGTVADVGLSNVLPRVVSRGTKAQKNIRRTEKELLNIENNYQKLRKNAKFSKDGNSATRSRVAKSGVLSDVVDPTGTIITDNAVKKYRELSGLNNTEGVVRKNLERLGETIDLNTLEQKLKATIYRSGLQGANLKSALSSVDNEIAGYRMRANPDGKVPLTLVHDAKIDTYNSIDFNTPSEIKQYKKLLARGLKESVEESSSFNVKQVNDELTPLLKDVEYLESLNGRKVKGGKLGKYSARIAGNIAGGIAGGSVGGFPGSAIGTIVGGEVGDIIQGRALRNTFGSTPLTNLPESEILKKAVTTGNSPRLQLPAPAKNAPRIRIESGRTINLPSRTQSTIDAQSLANLKAQKIAPPSKMPSKVSIPKIISEKKTKNRQYDPNGTPIIRGEKENLSSLADPQEGDIFYHGTKKVNKDSLLKNGIDTNLNKKGYAEQPEAFYVGDKNEAEMYGDSIVGVRVKKGSNVKTLDMAGREWYDLVGKAKNSQESALGLRELRKRGYDAVNHGDEIEILNPKKFEVFEVNKLPARTGKGVKKDRLTEINKELKSLPFEGGDTLKTAQKKAILESERSALYRNKSKLSNGLKKLKKDFSSEAGFIATGFKNEGDLTTKILKDLEGKTTVSKQYILDATNRGELKQVERDITRQVLDTMPDGQINVKEFAEKVKSELLPLKVNSTIPTNIDVGDTESYLKAKKDFPNRFSAKFENITLPDELRGNVKNYSENVYESPIKTSAGDTHFGSGDGKRAPNYFGHTRIEDMADNKTRRVIEVQSDLYQKGNLEREVPSYINASDYLPADKLKEYNRIERRLTDLTFAENSADYKVEIKELQKARETLEASAKDLEQKVINSRKGEVAKLQQYNDPTAHFRMVREEIKKAAQDGKTKLQFPTGETAMKIEGLGDNNMSPDGGGMGWFDTKYSDPFAGPPLEPNDLRVGQELSNINDEEWIVTDVLGDGKFKAIPKSEVSKVGSLERLNRMFAGNKEADLNRMKEEFDISGKIDTNNPIYKFYEKDVQKYLNKYGGKLVTDDKGVTWIEIPIKKEYGDQAVEAFGKIGISPLFVGAGIGLAGVTVAGLAKSKLPARNKK